MVGWKSQTSIPKWRVGGGFTSNNLISWIPVRWHLRVVVGDNCIVYSFDTIIIWGTNVGNVDPNLKRAWRQISTIPRQRHINTQSLCTIAQCTNSPRNRSVKEYTFTTTSICTKGTTIQHISNLWRSSQSIYSTSSHQSFFKLSLSLPNANQESSSL